MIKHPWKCNYAATLSPEILHFQNFVVFFGGEACHQTPVRDQKNYLLAACLYFGSYRSPFFHTYRVDSSANFETSCTPSECDSMASMQGMMDWSVQISSNSNKYIQTARSPTG